MKTNVIVLNRKVSKIEIDVEELKETTKNTHRSVVLIEHKINEEIPVLFDGSLSQLERQEEHKIQIESHDERLSNHEMRIFTLENRKTV